MISNPSSTHLRNSNSRRPRSRGIEVDFNGHFVTRKEFEELKERLQALVDLLSKAQEYDTRSGQPDCEHDDKVQLLLKLADALGVDMEVSG